MSPSPATVTAQIGDSIASVISAKSDQHTKHQTHLVAVVTYTFFCDPPHLLKTARNCFANSYSHSRTRTLWVCETPCRCISIVHHTHYILLFTLQKNGQDISWKHVENLYLTETNTIGGVRLCPKLTKEYFWLSSYSKMRVYLAAQVN